VEVVLMAIGAVGGAIGGQLISGGIAYGLQKDSQAQQEKILKNQKQWLMADLRAAGLNPILAAGGIGGQIGGGQSTASAGSGADLGAAARAGAVFKAVKEKALADAGSARSIEQTNRMIMDRTQWENIELRERGRYNQTPAGRKDIRDQLKNERMMDPFRGHNLWSLGGAGTKGALDAVPESNAKDVFKWAEKLGIIRSLR